MIRTVVFWFRFLYQGNRLSGRLNFFSSPFQIFVFFDQKYHGKHMCKWPSHVFLIMTFSWVTRYSLFNWWTHSHTFSLSLLSQCIDKHKMIRCTHWFRTNFRTHAIDLSFEYIRSIWQSIVIRIVGHFTKRN